jgi:hypothetical protein
VKRSISYGIVYLPFIKADGNIDNAWCGSMGNRVERSYLNDIYKELMRWCSSVKFDNYEVREIQEDKQ